MGWRKEIRKNFVQRFEGRPTATQYLSSLKNALRAEDIQAAVVAMREGLQLAKEKGAPNVMAQFCKLIIDTALKVEEIEALKEISKGAGEGQAITINWAAEKRDIK